MISEAGITHQLRRQIIEENIAHNIKTVQPEKVRNTPLTIISHPH
jgi:hypothetical protein